MASSGSGAAGRRRAKDQAMAARLRGVVRNDGRCPICHALIKNGDGAFLSHANSGRCRPKKIARSQRADLT